MQCALAERQAEIGSVRETFFLSQLSQLNKVHMPVQGDFLVNNTYTFEVTCIIPSKKKYLRHVLKEMDVTTQK